MTISTPAVAVTGATGHIGGEVARLLSHAGIPAKLLVRHAARAPQIDGAEVVVTDYEHFAANVRGLTGVDTVFMVPLTNGTPHLRHHQDFIDAVVAAGVRHIVFVSFVGADPKAPSIYAHEYGATEEYLIGTGLDITILRANLYAEPLTEFWGDDGIRAPLSDGRVAPVARDDVAACVAAVLREPHEHVGRTYELSGPQTLDFHQIADLLTRAFDEPCTYEDRSEEETRTSVGYRDAPKDVLDDWMSLFTMVRHGQYAHVTDDVRHLLGREPRTAEDALTQQAHNIKE